MVQSPLFPSLILTRSYSSRVRHLLYPAECVPKSVHTYDLFSIDPVEIQFHEDVEIVII
jgi:hypothetical protein